MDHQLGPGLLLACAVEQNEVESAYQREYMSWQWMVAVLVDLERQCHEFLWGQCLLRSELIFSRLRALLPRQVVAPSCLRGDGLKEQLAVVEVYHFFRSLAHQYKCGTVIYRHAVGH